MNTEDNLQSDVDRRFKSRKVSKGALTIDSSVNISLINKLRNFDANCFEIDNKELTIERKKKERQQYEIESIDIIIEESQNKKKILKSRRKPQSINRYKITSENISLYSNVFLFCEYYQLLFNSYLYIIFLDTIYNLLIIIY